jgi:hypothetical protein
MFQKRRELSPQLSLISGAIFMHCPRITETPLNLPPETPITRMEVGVSSRVLTKLPYSFSWDEIELAFTEGSLLKTIT